MGCAFSSSPASSSRGALWPFAGPGVRVIHNNGYYEDFDEPGLTVARVNGKHSRYVLCSSEHLLQPGRAPFRPDDPLRPGTVYYLLPHSFFQSESSAVDLACLMNRLNALARKGGAGAGAKGPSPVDALFAGLGHDDEPPEQKEVPPELPVVAGPAPWRPRLDRIDESIGRASMRSMSSCSEA